MRKIKFRGLVPTGGWIFGLPIEHEYGTSITTPNSLHHIDGSEWNFNDILVRPETIGQFIGLSDRNGKEIYDGDILITDKGYYFRIIWDNEKARFTGVTKEEFKGRRRYKCVEWVVKNCEVVGNIYENPELL
jgi:hypothetical protein